LSFLLKRELANLLVSKPFELSFLLTRKLPSLLLSTAFLAIVISSLSIVGRHLFKALKLI